MIDREQAPTAKGKERQKEANLLGNNIKTTGCRLLECDSGKTIGRNFIGDRKKRTIDGVRRLKENIIIPRNESEAMRSSQSESWKSETIEIEDHIVSLSARRYKLHHREELTERLAVRYERKADCGEYSLEESIENSTCNSELRETGS